VRRVHRSKRAIFGALHPHSSLPTADAPATRGTDLDCETRLFKHHGFFQPLRRQKCENIQKIQDKGKNGTPNQKRQDKKKAKKRNWTQWATATPHLGGRYENQTAQNTQCHKKVGTELIEQRIHEAVKHDQHPQTTDGHKRIPGKILHGRIKKTAPSLRKAVRTRKTCFAEKPGGKANKKWKN